MTINIDVAIDDLTIGSRVQSITRLLSYSQLYSSYSHWVANNSNYFGTLDNYSQTYRIPYQYRPTYIVQSPFQLAMLRFKMSGTIPTEFKKYYSYGEFLQSC